MQMLRSWWLSRGFIWGMVQREFQGRYRRSLLGGVWAVLEPLSMILIYTLIFSQVMRAKLPGVDLGGWGYSIYICAGILAWEYFSDVVSRSQNMFIEHGNLLKKTNLPRSTLPVIVLATASINFLILLGLFLIFLLMVGQFPGWVLLGLVPLILVQQGIAVGLGLVLGTLNVFFRDVGKATMVALRFWFWLTPIVYPITIVPERFREALLDWNPMARLIGGYQGIFLTGNPPDWTEFVPQIVLALGLLGLGFFAFRRLSGELVDEL